MCRVPVEKHVRSRIPIVEVWLMRWQDPYRLIVFFFTVTSLPRPSRLIA